MLIPPLKIKTGGAILMCSTEGEPLQASFSNSEGTPAVWLTDRVLVLWLGVSPEPLRRESRVQDIGPPETSRPHIISISESSPRDLCLNAKTQLDSTNSKLQCWTPHAKQLARQEHNPTHYQRGCLKSYEVHRHPKTHHRTQSC